MSSSLADVFNRTDESSCVNVKQIWKNLYWGPRLQKSQGVSLIIFSEFGLNSLVLFVLKNWNFKSTNLAFVFNWTGTYFWVRDYKNHKPCISPKFVLISFGFVLSLKWWRGTFHEVKPCRCLQLKRGIFCAHFKQIWNDLY